MTLLSYQDTVHKLCAQAGLKREKDFESETRINPNAVRYDVGLASPSKVCIFYIFFLSLDVVFGVFHLFQRRKFRST